MTERTVFLEALEIADPAQRGAYLDRACAGDADLRRKVQSLLDAHERPGDFLECPAGAPAGTGAYTPDAAHAPANSPGPQAAGCEALGTLVGPYKLLELIGEGGMGVVWMAEQRAPVRRRVALKLVKAGMDTRQVVARFEAERQALALMDHPHIARVFDGGATDSGRPYFVMELVKGVPITRYCDDHKLTPRQRLELFLPVCQAVQHAHQKGVIHRDLKPSNILVAPYDGRPVPKVIDFGIAKAAGEPLTERTLFTGFGAVVGTPEYMSPEQAELNNQDIDTRSDVYSLGVLLYELLTGTTPLTRKRVKEGALLEVLRLIREEEPPRPSTRLSATAELPTIAANRGLEPRKLSGVVRGELDWIVMKALEKDRSRRYETANGLAMDVQRYLADEPVLACPPSAGYRLRKLARRHRAAVTVAGLVAALLLIGTAVSTALAVWATRAEGLAQRRLASETAEREKARAAERERKRQLVGAKLAQARAGRWSRQVGQRFEGVKALAEAAALARELGMDEAVFQDLRDEMIACLALADVRPLGDPWEGWPAGSSGGLGFDADLERYARSDNKGNIEVRQVEGDRLLASLAGHGPAGGGSGASGIRFSPDGTLLAVTYWHQIPGSRNNFRVWDWRRNKVVFQPEYAVTEYVATGVYFSPDGGRLALGQADGAVVVYAVRGWNEVSRLKAAFPPYCLAFHPDGTRLAVAGPQGSKVQVWEATGKLVYEVTAPGTTWVAWHPNGDLLAAGCHDRCVHLWDGATGVSHAVLKGHQFGGIAVAFAAGGDLLVSTAWDGTTRLWDPWTQRELLRFAGDARHVSRDGGRLAGVAVHTATVWEIAPGREYLPLPRRPGTGGGVSRWGVSPDGRWLVSCGERGRVWDLGLRQEGASLPGGVVVDVEFCPNAPEFLTSGSDGVFRWSFEAGKGALRIRPAARLLPPGRLESLALDREGRQAAVARGWGATVLDLKNPPGRVPGLVHPNAVSAALSPDGRWAATGVHEGSGVKVWDARTGKVEKELVPAEHIARAAFSPDGRWLLVLTGAESEVLEVGTWRPVRRLPREEPGLTAAAFSPDGRVLALPVSPTVVRLFETTSWQPLARLQGPDADLINHVGFTPDGTRLLVCGPAGVLRLWDLRRVRAQLAEAQLDWDQPAYPPAPPPGDVKPVRAEVDAAAYERWAKADEALREGQSHAQAARWPQAVEAYTRALKLNPQFAEALVGRGQAYRALGQYEKAVADLSGAIRLNPNEDSCWNQRGWTYAQMNRWDNALADFSKAVELAPDELVGWKNRAWAHRHQGHPDRALADYSKVIELNPKEETAWDHRGMAYSDLGQPDRAVADYSQAIELNPNRADYRNRRGVAYTLLGQWDKALADFARALELAPNDPVVQNNLAWVLATRPEEHRRDPGRAVELAEKAVKSQSKAGTFWTTLGVAWYRHGNWKGAAEALEEALKQFQGAGGFDRGVGRSLLFLAMARRRLGESGEARRAYDRGVEWLAANGKALAATPAHAAELQRLRAEAAALLGVPDPQPAKDK